MEDDKIQELSMEDVMAEIDNSMREIYSGDVIEGEVISVSDSEALVNIGYIRDGIIKREEISYGDVSPKDILKPGDKVNVLVLKLNDGDGNVLLSKKKADIVKSWDFLEESFNKGTSLDVKVEEVVKGGVIGYVNGIRGFIPASHLSLSYVKDLNEFVGKVLKVKVIEFDREKQKVVLSRKEVEKEEAKAKEEKLWNSLEVGQKRSGVVSRLAKFGAFVDLGGVDGLIHNSDLSWKRVNNPSEVVNVGDKVEVYVIDFDKEKGRISLGLKDKEEDPWNSVDGKFKPDDIVDGTVVRLMDFGAFVELEPGIEGLVHVSQISDENITKPSQVLKINDKVKVKVLDVNKEEKRISLSIKEAKGSDSVDYSKYNTEDEGNFLFKDLLKNLKL